MQSEQSAHSSERTTAPAAARTAVQQGTGCEWIVDAWGCAAEHLRSLSQLEVVCERVIADLGLNVVGQPVWHQFPGPAGVTGLYLLSESHLACHTYPERCYASFNLYCCRPRADWPWADVLGDLIGAEHVEVRCVPRGIPDRPPQPRRPR